MNSGSLKRKDIVNGAESNKHIILFLISGGP